MPGGRRLVFITKHGIEQMKARWPDLAVDDVAFRFAIIDEINSGLDEGRYATRLPHWALPRGRSRRERPKDRSVRFVWTEAEDRLYVVSRHDGAVNVVTAIRPRDTLPS